MITEKLEKNGPVWTPFTEQREMQYQALRAEAALAEPSLTQVHMQPEFYSFHVLGVKLCVCFCVDGFGWEEL